MAAPSPQASDYQDTLRELTSNNKNQINLLTILADDYNESAAEIVNVIDAHIRNAPRDQKLPVMYLMDSIVKNVGSHYKDLFSLRIVSMFLHVFQNFNKKGDERIRMSLHKLRQTWTDIFPRSKLYDLDLKVHDEDPAWPVNTPTTSAVNRPPLPRPVPDSGAQVHVNPRFLRQGQTVPATQVPRDPPARTVTAPPPANNHKGEVKPILKGPRASIPATSSRDPRMAAKSATVPPEPTLSPIEKPQVKDEPMDESPVVAPPVAVPPRPAPIPVKSEVMDKDERIPSAASATSQRKDDGEKERPPRKRESDTQKDRRRMPETVKERSPPPKNPRRSPPTRPLPNERRNRPIGGPPRMETKGRDPRSSLHSVTPTNVAGTHAFVIPPRVGSQLSPTRREAPGSGAIPPSYPLPDDSSASPRDTDARIPNSGMPMGGPAPIPGLTGLISSSYPSSNPFGPNRGYQAPPLNSTAPIGPPMGGFHPPSHPMPPPHPHPPPRMTIVKEENRLDGIPANNRIFVDGKAYEVMYIGETAVIERDGLPHRIYFTGPPKNVVIDGTVYLLSFGESKDVLIDGDIHKIKFGAPSRELYMGEYPFRGAFGGPPIFATINGTRHEIRLSGPAPEVKIEPEPSYELARFVQEARFRHNRSSAAPPPASLPPKQEAQPTSAVFDLLSKLKKGGIFKVLEDSKTKTEAASSPPPVPADVRGIDNRAAAPHAAFEKNPFDMRLLKIRYDSVVAALLEPRCVCAQCGLRLEGVSIERRDAHKDWHIQRNLAVTVRTESRSRQWYGSAKAWVEAEDTAEDEESGEGVNTGVKSSAVKEEEPEKELPSMASNQALSKKCCACGDEFEEYFDSEADEWRLKDYVAMGGDKACHVGCAQDVTTAEEPIEEEKEESKPLLTDPRLRNEATTA